MGSSIKKILLIDDEDIVLEVGERMLSRLGYEVVTARLGKEGVDIYKKNYNDIFCVLLDFSMPDMDGKAVLESIRTINRDIKVIIISGLLDQDIEARFDNQKPTDFIEKPFQYEKLKKKLDCIKQRADYEAGSILI